MSNNTTGGATGSRATPYVVGAAIGVLSWAVFYVVNSPLGITTAMSQLSAAAPAVFVGWDEVAKVSYWGKQMPKLDYSSLFLAGTLIGGFLSAVLAGVFRLESVPRVWAEQFGGSVVKRYAMALIGGAIAMYGARLANGCTSGNGISGGLQLAVSGWTFLAVMFVTASLTALLMFRSK